MKPPKKHKFLECKNSKLRRRLNGNTTLNKRLEQAMLIKFVI